MSAKRPKPPAGEFHSRALDGSQPDTIKLSWGGTRSAMLHCLIDKCRSCSLSAALFRGGGTDGGAYWYSGDILSPVSKWRHHVGKSRHPAVMCRHVVVLEGFQGGKISVCPAEIRTSRDWHRYKSPDLADRQAAHTRKSLADPPARNCISREKTESSTAVRRARSARCTAKVGLSPRAPAWRGRSIFAGSSCGRPDRCRDATPADCYILKEIAAWPVVGGRRLHSVRRPRAPWSAGLLYA